MAKATITFLIIYASIVAISTIFEVIGRVRGGIFVKSPDSIDVRIKTSENTDQVEETIMNMYTKIFIFTLFSIFSPFLRIWDVFKELCEKIKKQKRDKAKKEKIKHYLLVTWTEPDEIGDKLNIHRAFFVGTKTKAMKIIENEKRAVIAISEVPQIFVQNNFHIKIWRGK